jgi:hypothetical protein
MTLVVTTDDEGKAAGASQANSAAVSSIIRGMCAKVPPGCCTTKARAFQARLKAAMTASGDLVLGGSGESAIRGRAYLRDAHDQRGVTRPGDLWLLVRAAFPATAHWPAMRVILLRSPR